LKTTAANFESCVRRLAVHAVKLTSTDEGNAQIHKLVCYCYADERSTNFYFSHRFAM